MTTTKVNYMDLFSSISGSENVNINETAYFKINDNGTLANLDLNPYQEQDIKIDATFTSPSGLTYYRPAYYYQEYELSLISGSFSGSDPITFPDELTGLDNAKKTGDPFFRFSIRPKEVGKYTYIVDITINGEFVKSISGEFHVVDTAESSSYLGKIEIDESNNTYFKYENGGSYIPVGMNNAWYTSSYRKSYDYDVWFSHMKESGMNYTRIWLASWSFGLHIGAAAKVDNFDTRQNQLARLDRVLALAEEMDIYVCLCLLNHGQFSKVTDAEWNSNPYNELVDYPFKFFSDETCKTTYKYELRYIIGRYGDFDSIMTYELFNEVDWIDGYSGWKNQVTSWHEEMAKYINSIDAYDRLISTSYKTSNGPAYKLDSIDFVNIHDYSTSTANDIPELIKSSVTSLNNSFTKPVMYEEWGVNASSGPDTYDLDPSGITYYQTLYASVLSGAASIPMNWWWDTYIHKYDLYYLYEGVAKLITYMNLSGNVTYLNNSNVTYSNENLEFLGLKTDSGNFYAYLYDENYSRLNTELVEYKDVAFNTNISNGTYNLIVMNALSGEIISEEEVKVADGNVNINLSFNNDVVIIINKKGE